MAADERVLPSWRGGATRDAILEFVASVTEGPDAVPVDERIAVFDNDGTLWTEKPMPTQLHYIVQRWAAAAAADPELAEQQPYTGAASGDLAWLGQAIDRHYAGDDSDLPAIIGAIVAATGQVDVPYDTGAEAAVAAASEHGFTVVSVKHDWAAVFPEPAGG